MILTEFKCFCRERNYKKINVKLQINSRKFQSSWKFQNNVINDVKQISSNGFTRSSNYNIDCLIKTI